MTFAEINAAIAAGNTTDLEDAFKAMVEYPGHAGCIPGATPENLKHALDRVCGALLEDDRIMPGGTFDAIRGTIPDESELLGGCNSRGAIVVKKHLPRFRALFARA
jgi:hypothetical protein